MFEDAALHALMADRGTEHEFKQRKMQQMLHGERTLLEQGVCYSPNACCMLACLMADDLADRMEWYGGVVMAS